MGQCAGAQNDLEETDVFVQLANTVNRTTIHVPF